MTEVVCSHCGTKLRIDECDTMPGCREMGEVKCPNCNKVADSIFTSGIPQAYVVGNDDND